MKCSLKALILAGLFELSSSHFSQAGSLLQIRDTTRNIEQLQDAVAFGDLGSLSLMQKIMLQLEKDISLSTAEQLSEPRNVKAVALYLLSGGNPNAVAKAYKNIKIEHAEHETLLEASLAYARSNKEEARAAIGKLEIENLPANIAGRLYIAHAILISESDLPAAIASLKKASVVMHGTMVEEASLRRCASFAAKANDIQNFKNCSENYMRRFSKSIYWKDFSANLIISSASIEDPKTHYYQTWLKPTLDELPTAVQLEILLGIAKYAVPLGNFILANKCGIRAVQLSDEKSSEKNLGLLYAGASMLGLNEVLLAESKLNLINVAILLGDDLALYHKARSVLEQVHAVASKPNVDAEYESLASPDAQSKSFDDLIARADLSLKQIDAELMRPSQ